MSMIEKFKGMLAQMEQEIEAAKKEAAEFVTEQTANAHDGFIEKFAEMVGNASDAAFIEFITSGKLTEDDIMAAITFRAQATPKSHADVCADAQKAMCQKMAGKPVRVIVVSGIK